MEFIVNINNIDSKNMKWQLRFTDDNQKDLIVEKIPVNNENMSLIDKNYDIDRVYSVLLKNTEAYTSGKLTVLVDLEKRNS